MSIISYKGVPNISTLTLPNTSLATYGKDIKHKVDELNIGDIDIIDLKFLPRLNGTRFDVLVFYKKLSTHYGTEEVTIKHD